MYCFGCLFRTPDRVFPQLDQDILNLKIDVRASFAITGRHRIMVTHTTVRCNTLSLELAVNGYSDVNAHQHNPIHGPFYTGAYKYGKTEPDI